MLTVNCSQHIYINTYICIYIIYVHMAHCQRPRVVCAIHCWQLCWQLLGEWKLCLPNASRQITHTHKLSHACEMCTHTHMRTHTHVQRHVQLDTVVYTFAAHLIAALGQLACGCLAWRLCLQIFAQMFANLTQVALPPLPLLFLWQLLATGKSNS